jgi:hypothetical protein
MIINTKISNQRSVAVAHGIVQKHGVLQRRSSDFAELGASVHAYILIPGQRYKLILLFPHFVNTILSISQVTKVQLLTYV